MLSLVTAVSTYGYILLLTVRFAPAIHRTLFLFTFLGYGKEETAVRPWGSKV